MIETHFCWKKLQYFTSHKKISLLEKNHFIFDEKKPFHIFE